MLPTSAYDAGVSVIPVDLSGHGNGLYELGIQVTCNGESFISDVTKGSIDRNLPEVLETFPAQGGAVDSSQDIRVVFDEPLNCKATVAILAVGNLTSRISISCDGSAVRILLNDDQVRFLESIACCNPSLLTSILNIA